MIAAVRTPPIQPVKRLSQAPQPAPKAPVTAGGGMEVNQNGDIVVKQNVLGFIPVRATLGMEDILGGKYGRDFRLDFTDADHARLKGDAHYGIISKSVDTPIDLHSGGAVTFLSVHVNDDRTMQVQGEINLFGWKLPLSINTLPTKVSPGVFDFTFNSFQIGSKGTSLPVAFAAWTLSLFVNLFSQFDGIKALDFRRLQVDFRRLNGVTLQQPAPQPQPQSSFERTA
ncbi:MAG TPA: hypothetical protein V6D05_12400 [Stenomitos sp.]